MSMASIDTYLHYWNNDCHLICCVLLSVSVGGHVYWLDGENEVESPSSSFYLAIDNSNDWN